MARFECLDDETHQWQFFDQWTVDTDHLLVGHRRSVKQCMRRATRTISHDVIEGTLRPQDPQTNSIADHAQKSQASRLQC